MLVLRTMTQAEYDAYVPVLRESYAQERARNLRASIESQREESNRQIAELLPQGVETPNHFLWRVVEDGGTPVGILWVFLDAAAHKAFIYDIEIEEAQRGKGYGSETLKVLEEALQPHQVQQIGLNVFGDNQTAFHLYQKMGYYTMATHMQKDL